MDVGQAILITSRLILVAIAVFFAILLWSKRRDMALMFLVIGIVAAYIEIVYSILNDYGFITIKRLLIGSVPFFEIFMSTLKWFCFIAAFFIMIFKRRSRLKK